MNNASTAKASNFSVFMRLLRLFKPYWGWMLLSIFLSLITMLANVSLMALSGWFISIMAIAGVAGITDINYFTPSAAIRGLAITRTAGRYIERVVSHEATFRLLAELRQWFYTKLEPLAPAVLQKYNSGDILSRISADINTLENFHLRIVSPFVVAIIAFILYGFFLNHYHHNLAVAELSLLFIAGIIMPIIIYRLAKPSSQRMVKISAELRTHAIDSVQGMGELLIYGAADKHQQESLKLSQKLIADQQIQAKLSGLSQGIVGFSANLSMWLILLISIPLINSGILQKAHLAMLALFAIASYEVILPLPLALQLLPSTLTAARRLFELADSKPAIKEPSEKSPQPQHFDIAFKQVSFEYQQQANNKLAINKLSFQLKTGGKLALLGESGIGKSTVSHLLSRFWTLEKNSGEIHFGGYPIEQYHSEDLRKYFAVLSQQNILFNNTIKSNLLLANPNASDVEIKKACQVAQIHDFIVSQPDGYNTWVGEAGLMLSGGQARRIAIARTLLKEAPILILDEPGEGLDANTEKALLKAIFTHKKNTSILLITHKKAGLDLVDEIYSFSKSRW